MTGNIPMLRAAGVDLPFDVRLSDGNATKLAGRPVIVGVRPEDILIASPGNSSIPCRVLLVEPMGNVNIVHAEAGRHRLVLTTDSAFRAAHGETVNLVLKAEKVHLFDQRTSERVPWQTA
jgi:multiple sugar transport system ATP-binding protein